MHITRFPLLASIVALTIVGIVLAVAIFGPENANGTPRTHAYPPPIQPVSGIIPKSHAAVAFSTQNVQQYVLTHRFPGGAVVAGHTIKIISIKLMTRQQADAQGAELAAYATTNMVYVVNIEGPFYTTYVKALGSISSTVLKGYEIFDAHTGDTLEWGIPS